MRYKIEMAKIAGDNIILNGWVVTKNPMAAVSYAVVDDKGITIDAQINTSKMDDISKKYYGKIIDKNVGFDIRFIYENDKEYYLILNSEKYNKKIKLNKDIIDNWDRGFNGIKHKLPEICNMKTLSKGIAYLKKHGIKRFFIRLKKKLSGDADTYAYEYTKWYDKTKPTPAELDNQRHKEFTKNIKFSIVIPAYKSEERYMKALLDSIIAQTYSNFEICIADGSPKDQSIENILKPYADKDNRIKYKVIGDNLGISDNTNAALDMATGDFIILCDHDDMLPEYALYECANAIENNPECDCIYSDEDKINSYGQMSTDPRYKPHFKPDFNIDLLCSTNYICHMFVVKKDLVDRYGRFDHEYDGAQDYDFIFRMTEKAKCIIHIPKVLYHWRCHDESTSINPDSKLYAYEAGARAIKAHYDRVWQDIKIDSIDKGTDYGIYHIHFHIDNEPLISVLIPNKDHTEDLDKAIRSIMKGTYKNLEFIIIENNSTEDKTWQYYDDIEKQYDNVKVIKWDGAFNYSAINNYGEKYAKGEYILLLNNDVSMISPDSISEMMGYAQRKDVGAVGCKLYYGDDTIQHAGVVIGFGGIAGHAFTGIHKSENSYFNRADIAQDYSAVTAACMLIPRDVYEEVGGLSEELAIAFNDVDLCLKIRKTRKLIVYNPYATFYHYESKSRGYEDTPEKIDRFNKEIATILKKWPDIIENGDPYYNPNLTLRKSDFSLRDLELERIGKPFHIEGIEKYL